VTSASHLFSDHLLSSEGIHCFNLFKYLEKYGYHFDIITPFASVLNPLDNVDIFQTGTIMISPNINLKQKYELHLNFLMKGLSLANELLRTRQYDIVHHILPAVYGHTFSPLAISKKNFSLPFLFGPISCHFIDRPIDERFLRPITNKLHFDTIHKCDRIIVINKIVKNLYNNLLDDERISTIPFGVDKNMFYPLNKKKNNVFEILYVGSLTNLKGVSFLIKALPFILKEESNVILKIVGKGSRETYLKELVKKLNIDKHVFFSGFIQHHKTPGFFQQCDVFCYPTLGEPFGKAIIEAMACGKPVVCTELGTGTSYVNLQGETGLVVPPRDSVALAKAINQLLADPNLRHRLGEGGRRRAKQEFSRERMIEETAALYERLLSNGR